MSSESGVEVARGPASTEGSSTRVETDIVVKARYLASRRGLRLMAYLSGILRPAVQADFAEAGKSLMGAAQAASTP